MLRALLRASMWLVQHRTVDLDGPVHYADFGGSGRPIVLVHGLGGSHANWLSVGGRLAAHGRVLAVDLAGHGRTRSLGRSARVGANRRLLGHFLDAVAREPAVLVGNSMGGTLSLDEAAAEPGRVASLVLVDPAVPIARGAGFDRQVLAFFAGFALPLVGGALVRRRRFYEMVSGIRARALIVQGERDRLVRVEATRALAAARPDWRLEVLDDVGHVPQLEAPQRFLAVVEPWLAEHAAVRAV